MGLSAVGAVAMIARNTYYSDEKTDNKEKSEKMMLRNVSHLSPVNTNQQHATVLSFEEDGKQFVGFVQHEKGKIPLIKNGETMSKMEWEKKLTPAGAYFLYTKGNER